MPSPPADDLGAALGLFLDVQFWIESTPESQIEPNTAGKWEEGIGQTGDPSI